MLSVTTIAIGKAINNIVKGLLSEPPLFNLHRVELPKYKDIVEILKRFNPTIKLTFITLPA